MVAMIAEGLILFLMNLISYKIDAFPIRLMSSKLMSFPVIKYTISKELMGFAASSVRMRPRN